MSTTSIRLSQFVSALALGLALISVGGFASVGGRGPVDPSDHRGHTASPDNSPNAMSFGVWTPSGRDTCTKEQHDAFSVIGPDGKRYPTWHPPTGPNGCTFGHEHGRDPRQSKLWSTRQIQTYFYFDANRNHVMDPDEEAVTGIPFGYVNEQYDAYNMAQGSAASRHEDHVGHKIDWVNGEADVNTHRMTTDAANGAWVGQHGGGVVEHDTHVRCFYLAKVHQGVTTTDAFTNNLHEVMYFNDCRHPQDQYSQQISMAQLVAFNRPGGFTKFMPLCGIGRRSDPRDFVVLSRDSQGRRPPLFVGDREIVTRDCVETGFLVPSGEWSGNLYEAWSASLSLATKSGRRISEQINLLFDVEDPIRYFYPEQQKDLRGYSNQAAGANRGFAMDLCYDRSLAAQSRRYRGGLCAVATDHDRIPDIGWDDPRSAFRGLHRGMYFMPAVIDNANGPSIWYADPLGGSASTVSFAGAIAQQVSRKRLNYSTLIEGRPIDPRVTDRIHDDGGGTVHAPN